MPRIAITREHKITLNICDIATGNCITTIVHTLTIHPITTKVVIIVISLRRLTRYKVSTTIIIVHKSTHTETLIVDNVVTKVHAIDGTPCDFIARSIVRVDPAHSFSSIEKIGIVANSNSIINNTTLCINRVLSTYFLHLVLGKECFDLVVAVRQDPRNINLGIVLTISVHIRSLEEVYTYCGRNTRITTRARTIILITIVAVTKTSLNVATDIVIVRITKIRIDPLAKISLTQLISRTVDDFVRIEGHVVDLVIRRESKSLRTNFKANRLTTCLRMSITHVIEDPPYCLVAF